MSAKFNFYQLRKWSVKVRWRDRVCQACGRRDKLQAHHLNSKSYFPDEAYDLINGVALCGSGNKCHQRFHVMFMKGTRRKCTKDDWERFKAIMHWTRNQIKVSGDKDGQATTL